MNYISVCSGIEAASVAWHALGWTPAAFSEIEPFPSAVLSHRFPGVPNLGDMTRYKEWNIGGSIDLLVGGTPCQAFSIAGLRKGLADPRGNLALVYLGIADHFRPRWLVWENVPGVLSSNGGRDFGAFLGALAELGYGFAYRVLDAQYFGVAQRRRRVFVVGYLGDWRPAAAVLFEPESVRGYPAPSRETGKGAARGVEIGPGGGRFTGLNPTLDARAKDGPIRNQLAGAVLSFGGNNRSGDIDVAAALLAKGGSGRMDFGSETFVAHTLRSRYDSSEDGTGRGTPLVPVAFPANLSGTQCASTEDLCPAMGATNPTAIAFDPTGSSVNPSINLAQCPRGVSGGNAGHHSGVALGSAARRLTPRECERLQGFPDDWTLIPWKKKPADQCPDGPRYKACGNSMAVPVMAWIGRRIAAVDEHDLDVFEFDALCGVSK